MKKAGTSVGDQETARPPDTGTVARIVILLRNLAESSDPPTLKDLADRMQLPMSTVHRLLGLLARDDMVERDAPTRTFRPGREFVRLASLVSERMSLKRMAAPFLEAAAKAGRESCYLGALDIEANQIRFVSVAQSDHLLDYRVPLDAAHTLALGASGLAILAWMSPKIIDRVLAMGPVGSKSRMPAKSTLVRRLAVVRAQGYAEAAGQRIPGAIGFFAPVFDRTGAVCGSVGFTLPETRFQESGRAGLVKAMLVAARGLSRALGHPHEYPPRT